MKILHVIPSVAPRYGGPSRAVVEMCRALNNGGIDTLIATTDANGAERLDVELGKPTTFQGVATIFFPRQLTEAYKYSHPLAVWLDQHVADFDVVHIHAVFSHSSISAATACRRARVPYIVRPLGTLDPWSLKQKSLKKNLFWHLGVKQMLDEAAAIHYTAEAERRLVEDSLGLKHGVVVPLGIEQDLIDLDTPKQQAIDSDKTPYVLVLSRLHQKKGLELLLPAFLSLARRPEFANWKLVLAGEGETKYLDSLKSLASSHGGNGNVVFTGWLEGERRRSVLRDASLLALTSYQENFGLCAVEALACGVPVLISTEVNLADEIKAAKAGWVTELEPGAIEKTLAEALAHEEARTQRGLAGQKFVRDQFSWPAIADRLSEVYRSLARPKHPAC